MDIGQVVEVHSLSEWSVHGEWTGSDLNGRQGVINGPWQGDLWPVLVFSLGSVALPTSNLRTSEPRSLQDGGFDLLHPFTWNTGNVAGAPSEHALMVFGIESAQCLSEKGYCLVQMFHDRCQRVEVANAAREMVDGICIQPEFQEAYLGTQANSKIVWLDGQILEDDALQHYFTSLQSVVEWLGPAVGEALGFEPGPEPLAPFLRQPLANDLDAEMLSYGERSSNAEEDFRVERFLDFLKRRRCCMLYMIDGEGGTIELTPRTDWDGQPRNAFLESVKLPISKEMLLVFRHDELAFSYRPMGEDLVLQAWLGEALNGTDLGNIDFKAAPEVRAAYHGQVYMKGPELHQTDVIAIGTRYSGECFSPDEMWQSYFVGIDGFAHIPQERIDFSQFPEHDEMIRHGAFVPDLSIATFSHDTFNISEDMAGQMHYSQQVCMEVSYECFNRAGYDNSSLKGRRIPTYVGDQTGWSIFSFESLCFKEVEEDPQKAIWTTVDTATRLQYVYGLKGPAATIDTACSSGLVSISHVHNAIRLRQAEQMEKPRPSLPTSLGCLGGEVYEAVGLAMGLLVLTKGMMLGMLKGSRLLSFTGRSFTFDHSANGYARGEGCGGLFLAASTADSASSLRLGCIISSFMGQDGKSASLTAPSGSAQQESMRMSLEQAKRDPSEVIMSECHGTGTALGDPIETGSLYQVFSKHCKVWPLYPGAAKTNLGHVELGAGTVGFITSLLQIVNGAIKPNNHIRVLNPNCNVEGFPIHFATELTDANVQTFSNGISAFGFGGTNCRADIWGFARDGVRKVAVPKVGLEAADYIIRPCPACLGQMCWLCGLAIGKLDFRGGRSRHRCEAVRSSSDARSYEVCSDCYTGSYELNEVIGGLGTGTYINPYQTRVYMVGTWSVWKEYHEMALTDYEEYRCEFRIGDCLWEQFHIVLDKDDKQAIHPIAGNGDHHSRVVGPDDNVQGNHWLVDCRGPGAIFGAICRVTLTMDTPFSPTKLSWEVLEELAQDDGLSWHGHQYFIRGSWSQLRPQVMSQSSKDPRLWQFSFAIGCSGQEEFQFLRDQDEEQVIYPMQMHCTDSEVDIAGPDGAGAGYHWLVSGVVGELVTVKLRHKAGKVSLHLQSTSVGEVFWQSSPGYRHPKFYLIGSFNDWEPEAMFALQEQPGSYKCMLEVGDFGEEEFQIIENMRTDRVLCPEHSGASPGSCATDGPNANRERKSWKVVGEVGEMMWVTLNLHPSDLRQKVTCARITYGE